MRFEAPRFAPWKSQPSANDTDGVPMLAVISRERVLSEMTASPGPPPRPVRHQSRPQSAKTTSHGASSSTVAGKPEIKRTFRMGTAIKRPTTSSGIPESSMSKRRVNNSDATLYSGLHDEKKVHSSTSKSGLNNLHSPPNPAPRGDASTSSLSSASLSRRKSLDHPPSPVRKTGIFSKPSKVFTPADAPKVQVDSYFGTGFGLYMEATTKTPSQSLELPAHSIAGPSVSRPTSPHSDTYTTHPSSSTSSHPPSSMPRYALESHTSGLGHGMPSSSTANVSRKSAGMSMSRSLLSKASKGALALGLGGGRSTLGAGAQPRHALPAPRRVSSPPIRPKQSISHIAPTEFEDEPSTPRAATPLHPHLGASQPPSGYNDLRFSTVDRTILEQLKATLLARQAHFVMKGPFTPRPDASLEEDPKSGSAGGLYNSYSGMKGTKHHMFSSKDVPYPRNYEREGVDMDVWDSLITRTAIASVTWHVFEEDPPRVLDIGCGCGDWVIEAAKQWKTSQFVGLDVVPLHPDLRTLGMGSLAQRITFTQANFLQRLPFPAEEFDYVHIKRIGRAVPEDKWDILLEEVHRVLKPGGAVEVFEEDLFFPGKPMRRSGDWDSEDSGDDISSDGRQSALFNEISGTLYPSGPLTDSAISLGESRSKLSLSVLSSQEGECPDVTFPTSVDVPVASPIAEEINEVPSTPLTRRRPRAQSSVHVEARLSQQRPRSSSEAREEKPLPPHPHSATSTEDMRGPVVAIYRSETRKHTSSNPSFISAYGEGLPLPSPRRSEHRRSFTVDKRVAMETKDALQHLIHRTTSTPGQNRAVPLRNSTLPASPSSLYPNHYIPPIPRPPPRSAARMLAPPPPRKPSVDTLQLLKTLAKPPLNPREHNLLEHIYNEMHSERFINLMPLSILANSMNTYFKNVRSHPAVLIPFPVKVSRSQTRTPAPAVAQSDLKLTQPQSPPADVETSIFQGADFFDTLVTGEDAFFAFDRLPGVAQAWGKSTSMPKCEPTECSSGKVTPNAERTNARVSPAVTTLAQMGRMPNTCIYLDVRWINQHLALKASEVTGVSEAMWEWVVSQQQSSNLRTGSSSCTSTSAMRTSMSSMDEDVEETLEAQVLQLTRAEFDGLLTTFDLDMRDYIGAGDTLETGFKWNTIPTMEPDERKAFDKACEKWDAWVEQKHHRRAAPNAGNGKPVKERAPVQRHSRSIRSFCAWKA